MFCRICFTLVSTAALASWPAFAQAQANCPGLPSTDQLKAMLGKAPSQGGDAGGLFHGQREWGVIVNRAGEVCAVTASPDPSQVWPASQSIAKSKAFTANGFSLDSMPLSTARLYTLVQPGHSLYGTAFAEPFNPQGLIPASSAGQDTGKIQGGAIAFGGGVPLYRNGAVIGALGVSGDTSCADHEIAKRVRSLLSLDPPGGSTVDDITYPSVDGPSVFSHALCQNTWRNGKFVGNESVGGGWMSQQAQGTPATAGRRMQQTQIPK